MLHPDEELFKEEERFAFLQWVENIRQQVVAENIRLHWCQKREHHQYIIISATAKCRTVVAEDRCEFSAKHSRAKDVCGVLSL